MLNQANQPLCPLCGRPIPEEAKSRHHLVPKSLKGRETVLLHRICHRKIHSLFTERELQKRFSTIEALKSHPEMAAFLNWVGDKPAGFYVRTEPSRTKRSSRKGAQNRW
ncbi:MAG: HNH endonuclease signature motif containing protein [Pseudomonadota bacterium]